MVNKPCGPEMILDLVDCDVSTFTKESLEKFFIELCDVIDMTRTELHMWEYFEDPTKPAEEFEELKGISAVQFIKTSSILVHTFDSLNKISINLYSCKPFNTLVARKFCEDYFKGTPIQFVNIQRG